MARLKLGDRRCAEAYLPYQLDERRFGWIDYRLGDSGPDIVAITVDLDRADAIAAGNIVQESLIVQDGRVVDGHACDMNSFWNNLYWCCGPSALGCLATGPFWWACATFICGGCAVMACFWAGCC
jgi:hypothetical protein